MEKPTFESQVIHIKDLLEKQFSPIKWIIDPLIPAEGITIISGQPASYKTWFYLYLATKIASLEEEKIFSEFPKTQSGILIIDEENGDRLIKDRFKLLHTKNNLPICLTAYYGFQLNNLDVKTLIKFCTDYEYKVVIFDSLVRVNTQDENDAVKMSKTFYLLKQMNKAGITVILVHHHRKQGINQTSNSQNMRGSSEISAAIDSHLTLTRKDDYIEIEQTKLRQKVGTNTFKIKIICSEESFDFELIEFIGPKSSKKLETKNTIFNFLINSTKKLFKKQLFEQIKKLGVDIGERTFDKAYEELKTEEVLVEYKGEGNTKYCQINTFHPRYLDHLEQTKKE
jgi:KaiC/GvpD/RAD55 family RecA-like ATPase